MAPVTADQLTVKPVVEMELADGVPGAAGAVSWVTVDVLALVPLALTARTRI
jgi:hypothetical protein